MDEFDEQLSESLKRLGKPADPTGVADLIRARVAAGGPGASRPSRVPDGWRRLSRWALGLIIAAGIALVITGVLVAPLVFGAPTAHVASPHPSPSAPSQPAPSPPTSTTPIPTPITSTSPTPAPHPTPPPHSTPPPANHGGGSPPHHHPADTTKPVVGPTSVTPANYCSFQPGLTNTVTTRATDNRGVTAVTISWTGAGGSGSGSMSKNADGMWTFDIPATDTNHQVYVTVTAHDAAGNTASDGVDYFDGCVIG